MLSRRQVLRLQLVFRDIYDYLRSYNSLRTVGALALDLYKGIGLWVPLCLYVGLCV